MPLVVATLLAVVGETAPLILPGRGGRGIAGGGDGREVTEAVFRTCELERAGLTLGCTSSNLTCRLCQNYKVSLDFGHLPVKQRIPLSKQPILLVLSFGQHERHQDEHLSQLEV